MIDHNTIPCYKKYLVLTFSLVAAYKIKQEVVTEIPKELDKNRGESNHYTNFNINDYILVTNFHGFCRGVLSLYGYLIDENLANINNMNVIDDIYEENILKKYITDSEKITKMENLSMNLKEEEFNELDWGIIDDYLTIVRECLLSNNYLTFNSIILFTLKLFDKNPNLKRFYQIIYPYILVDEVQDTNKLGYYLLQMLITQETKLMFLGDSLQRIYGFIGAIPNLIDKLKEEYGMTKFELTENYRHQSESLKLLESNTRKLIKLIKYLNKAGRMMPDSEVNLDFITAENQKDELKKIAQLVKDKYKDKKVAILFRQTNTNYKKFIRDIFKSNNLHYFYALYTENNNIYIEFHKEAFEIFKKINKNSNSSLRNKCKLFLEIIKSNYKNIENTDKYEIYKSLYKLLRIFIYRDIFGTFRNTNYEKKVKIISNTLINRSLKMYMLYIKSNLILSTVHGAKGLEWDCIILPNLIKNEFPNKRGACENCKFKDNCSFDWYNLGNDKPIYNELILFYVGITRAKSKLIFSYSKDNNTNKSCFLNIPFIKLKEINNI